MATGDHGPRAFQVNTQRHPLFLVTPLLVCVVLFVSCGAANATAPAPPTSTPMTTPTPTPVVGVTHVTIPFTSQFQPASIQVLVGTTVTWTNNDNVGHTVTFRNGMKDSGRIDAGGRDVPLYLRVQGHLPVLLHDPPRHGRRCDSHLAGVGGA